MSFQFSFMGRAAPHKTIAKGFVFNKEAIISYPFFAKIVTLGEVAISSPP